MEDKQSNAEQMAKYRVEGNGICYQSMQFSSEEKNERRMWMRRVLQGTGFDNCSNDSLDAMRVWRDVTSKLFVEDENGYVFLVPSSKISSTASAYRRSRSGIPREYEDKMGKDFDWNIYGENINDAKSTVNQYITRYEEFCDKGMGLYIYSKERGSGKTMLASCILNEISKRYVGSVKFINVLDFIEMTKKGFNYDSPDIEVLYICKMLVIDDIGVQMDKEWINTVFYRLINHRYTNHKATIFTSNVECEKLNMDSRTVDRIQSASFMVDLPEVPVRRMLAEKRKEEMMRND